jgi:hypothetical protein
VLDCICLTGHRRTGAEVLRQALEAVGRRDTARDYRCIVGNGSVVRRTSSTLRQLRPANRVHWRFASQGCLLSCGRCCCSQQQALGA